jgi:hypothetical protein
MFIMLCRDQYIVNSYGFDTNAFLLVFNNNLGFTIWSEPRDLSRMSCFSELLANLVSKIVRVGVEGFSIPFICGIPEHKTLITSSNVFIILANVNSISNLGAL